MKKVTILMFMLISMINVHAQAPFTTYTPVTPGYSAPRQQSQDEQLQTVTAYFVNQRGAFEKIGIKVNVVQPQIGRRQVYVRAYYNRSYSMWSSMNSSATEITSYSNEPDVIKENFDYKCYVPNIGTVYF